MGRMIFHNNDHAKSKVKGANKKSSTTYKSAMKGCNVRNKQQKKAM